MTYYVRLLGDLGEHDTTVEASGRDDAAVRFATASRARCEIINDRKPTENMHLVVNGYVLTVTVDGNVLEGLV